MAQIVSRGGPRNLPSGVVTVAELLSRNQQPTEPVEDSPISVGSLLRREGRGPHSLDRPLQPRGTQQTRAAAGSGAKRVRRTVVAAGTFLAAGSVFGAAIVSDPAGSIGDQDVLDGIFPTQPGGPAGADPASGTAAIVDAAQSGPGGLDPGTAWSNVAYPRATPSAPAPGKAAAGSATPAGARAANTAAGGGAQTTGGAPSSANSGGTQTPGGTGGTGGAPSSGGTGAGSSGGGTGSSGGGSESGSATGTAPVDEVLDGTGKAVTKTTDDVAKAVDKTTGDVGKVLGKTTDAVGGLLGRTTGSAGKGVGFGGSPSDDRSPSTTPRTGEVVNDQVTTVGKLAVDSLDTVDSLAGDPLGAVDDADEVVEGTVGEVDKALGTLLAGDASAAQGPDADDDSESDDEPAERQKSPNRPTGDNPALSTLDDPGFETVEKSDEPTSSSAEKHKPADGSAGDNPALSTLDDPGFETVEQTGRHAAALADS